MAVVSHVDTQVPWDVPQREYIHLRLRDLVNPGDLFLEALVKTGPSGPRLAMKERKEGYVCIVLRSEERKVMGGRRGCD